MSILYAGTKYFLAMYPPGLDFQTMSEEAPVMDDVAHKAFSLRRGILRYQETISSIEEVVEHVYSLYMKAGR